MKKLFAVLAAILLLTIIACSGGGSGDNNASSKTIDDMTVVMDNGAKYYNDQINSGVTSEEAGNSTIDWLKKQDGVVDAYFDRDKDNIIVKDVTGIITYIIPNVSSSTDIQEASSKAVQIRKSIERVIKTAQATTLNAAIFEPYYLNLSNASLVNDALSKVMHVDYFQYSKASVSSLTDLKNYDIIYWFGHGGVNEDNTNISIGTGEGFTQAALDGYTKTLEGLGVTDISNEDGYNQYIIRFEVTGTLGQIGVTSKFIKAFSTNLKASVVYIDACHSLENDSMADAFRNNGAKSYFGWDGKVDARYSQNYPVDLFDYLYAGDDVQTAYDKIKNEFTSKTKATLKFEGEGTTKLPFYNTTDYTISGLINLNGAGLAGVTVTLTGTGSSSTTTDSSGNYSFTERANGNYTVTPSLTGYTFSPFSTAVTVSGADKPNINFTATSNIAPVYTISGQVTGAVVSGVTITLSGTGTASTTTDPSGNYSFSSIVNGSYTITPSPSGYSFSPTSRNITVSSANLPGQNFTATATPFSGDYTSPNIGTLIYVPAGSFQRDATSTDISTVSAFRMSQYEITRAQFLAIMGTDPSYAPYSSGTNDPVQMANWYHAIAFCNKLSIAEGLTPVYSVSGINFTTLTYADIPSDNATWNAATATWANTGYRLPTEMEWMWAAMGATSDGRGADIVGGVNTGGYTKGYAGSIEAGGAQVNIGDYAWTRENSSTGTKPVGTKLPNELGLHDMSENGWEWCWDWYADNGTWPYYAITGAVSDYRGAASGTSRVLRGGSWHINAPGATVAYRDYYSMILHYYYVGFRVVRP